MSGEVGSVKRTNRLAVFEHVIEKELQSLKRERRSNVYKEDSDSEDNDLPRKISNKKIKLAEEVLCLICEWDECAETFENDEKFNKHVMSHINDEEEYYTCKWGDCPIEISSNDYLKSHISHHAYLIKLSNIGDNAAKRSSLPPCLLEKEFKFPSTLELFQCEWEDCHMTFIAIYDFLIHMKMHMNCFPNRPKDGEPIVCCWEGCNNKFASRTKLTEHVRVHTKEKMIGCSKCFGLFSNRTKFIDHRKKQTPTEHRGYQCSQCLKFYPTERLLRDHIRSHVNHYKCTMCDMTCPKPSILAKHIRYRHLPDRFYKCTYCTKRFKEKGNLMEHLTVHKEMSYSCPHCHLRFQTRYSFKKHVDEEHNNAEQRKYECHCCQKRYPKGVYLTKHLMKKHNYHLPSGHTRFRYKKDEDGIHRLQTVRYESLEVSEDLMRSEAGQQSQLIQQSTSTAAVINIQEIDVNTMENNSILISVDDLDEEGNVLRSEIIKQQHSYVCTNGSMPAIE